MVYISRISVFRNSCIIMISHQNRPLQWEKQDPHPAHGRLPHRKISRWYKNALIWALWALQGKHRAVGDGDGSRRLEVRRQRQSMVDSGQCWHFMQRVWGRRGAWSHTCSGDTQVRKVFYAKVTAFWPQSKTRHKLRKERLQVKKKLSKCCVSWGVGIPDVLTLVPGEGELQEAPPVIRSFREWRRPWHRWWTSTQIHTKYHSLKRY